MAKGKARTKLLAHSSSLVEGHYGGPSWDFLYQVSTVKHPDYNPGDRVQLPDGRVFRYGKMSNDRGCPCCYGAGSQDAAALVPTAITVAQEIGDKEVSVPLIGMTVDLLRGGYVSVRSTGRDVGFGGLERWTRGILGNDASDTVAGTTKIYLDAALTQKVLVGEKAAVLYNPYTNLTRRISNFQSVIGIPTVSAKLKEYAWLQTWGPCYVRQGQTVTGTVDGRGSVFAQDGNLFLQSNKADGQAAGFIIENGNGDAACCPFIMLQISP